MYVCVCVCDQMEPGKGPTRAIRLHPTRVFAREIEELLTGFPNGLEISKINPFYKEKFKSSFSITNYGFSKLILGLEAIPDIITVCFLLLLFFN